MTMDPKRRHMLLAGGVAAVGVLSGAWWWRRQASAGLSAARADSLWSFECPTLAGDTLALRAFRGKPLVVNFWASWCPPCVAEMPLLDAFQREHAPTGWNVIGLAIDQPGAVQQFLAQHPVSYPIGLADAQGPALLRALGHESDGLPLTLAFDAQGRLLQEKLGRLIEEDLKSWANHAR